VTLSLAARQLGGAVAQRRRDGAFQLSRAVQRRGALLRRLLGASADKAINGGVPDSRDDADEPQWDSCIRSTLPHCQGGA